MADKPTGILSPEVEKLSNKLAKEPNSKVFFNLAEEYVKAGMMEEALTILTTGLKIHPSYVSANVLLGKLYFEKGMIKESRELFEQILKINPDNITANKKLALIFIDEKKFAEAEKCCSQILFFNPKDAETLEIKKKIAAAKEGKAEVKPAASPLSAPVPPKSEPPAVKPAPVKAPLSPPAVSGPAAAPAPPLPPGKSVQSSVPPGPDQREIPVAFEPVPIDQKESAPAVEQRKEESFEEPPARIYDPTISRPPDLKGVTPEPEIPLEAPLDFAASLSRQDEGGAPDSQVEDLAPEMPAAEVPAEEELMPSTNDSAAIDFSILSQESPAPAEASPGLPAGDYSHRVQISDRALPPAPPAGLSDQGGGKAIPAAGDLDTLALAELYIKQGHFSKGIEIYNKLLENEPGNQMLRQKLEEAKSLGNLLGHKTPDKKIEEKIIQAVVPEQVAPPVQEIPSPDAHVPGTAQNISEKNQAKIVKLKQWLEYIKKKNQ